MRTFALSHPGRENDVSIWCEAIRNRDGGVYFLALNGAWHGTFYPQRNAMKIDGEEKEILAVKVWEGEVPLSHGKNYNTAMEWIKAQLT